MFEFEIACKVTYFFRQKNKRNKKSSFSCLLFDDAVGLIDA